MRPLVLVENGKPKLEQRHIEDLAMGIKGFNDFL